MFDPIISGFLAALFIAGVVGGISVVGLIGLVMYEESKRKNNNNN